MQRRFAVAVRDRSDLFLWLWIKRASKGDIYYFIPTGRTGRKWEMWNPHGSHHASGQRHHKSFNHPFFVEHRQKPDGNFKGAETIIARPVASHEPRTFGVICHTSKFNEVMEIAVDLLSPKTYETTISIDLAEPGVPPNVTALGQIVAQSAFKDAAPWIWVTVTHNALPY